MMSFSSSKKKNTNTTTDDDNNNNNNNGGGEDYGNYTTYHFDDVDEMSDYESTGAPPPPPPPPETNGKNDDGVDGVHQDLEAATQKDGLNETTLTAQSNDYEDEYGDDERGEGGDYQGYRNDNDDDGLDGDDGSVEIPPTKVVQKMMLREQNQATETKSGNGTSTRVFGMIAICLLLAMVVILGVGFGTGTFGGDKNSSNSSSEESANNESETTSDPEATRPPVDGSDLIAESERGQEMRNFLSGISFGGADSFADTSSPESLALQWLVLEDPLQLDPTDAAQQFQLTQRYALATLWFNSDFTWAEETNWLNEDECTWLGITCTDSTETAGNSTANTASRAVTIINLEGNNVQGNIPQDLALLNSIVTLNLSDNIMEGEIPASLTSITTLEELMLDRNLLAMDMSNFDWSGLVNIQLLDVSSNKFSGTLPDSLWTLTTLEVLVLDNNAFTGELSGNVSQLTQLSTCS